MGDCMSKTNAYIYSTVYIKDGIEHEKTIISTKKLCFKELETIYNRQNKELKSLGCIT